VLIQGKEGKGQRRTKDGTTKGNRSQLTKAKVCRKSTNTETQKSTKRKETDTDTENGEVERKFKRK
jgi:hypothetical protein